MTAHKVLDSLPEFVDFEAVNVFPMRDGGVQIEIGEFKEIEIFNNRVIESQFDSNFNIINKFIYERADFELWKSNWDDC